MIKQATLAGAVLSVVVLGGPAFAEEAEGAMCPRPANAQLMTKDQLTAKLETMGYNVRGIEPQKGCWEVKGFDANGKRVEFHIDPVTAQIKQDED